MTTIYTPRQESDLTGANLSGSDGDANRTYNIRYTPSPDIMSVKVQGVSYTRNVDFTFNGATIIFLNTINNFMSIQLDYFTYSTLTSPTHLGNLKYSTVEGFARYLGLLQQVPNKDYPTKESLGTGDNVTTEYFLHSDGIIEGTYNIYYGPTYIALTEITHYIMDLTLSKIVLTSVGLALVGTNALYASYKYFSINSGLTNAEALLALNSAENQITNTTNEVFADYTDNDPKYKKVLDEIHHANSPSMSDWKNRGKVFDLAYPPLINLETTTNGNYVTGSSSITLSDTTGFPTSGTLNIADNKVAFTARTGNVLTIPTSTPSIPSGSLVKGEVIEVSFTPEGGTTLYNVITPELDYTIDYVQGRILLLSNAYWNQNVTHAEDTVYPTRYTVRICYMNAWYEAGEYPYIPSEIEQVTYTIAAQAMYPRIIGREYLKGNNNFRPGAFNSTRDDIRNTLINYKPLNVGTSPCNRSRIS